MQIGATGAQPDPTALLTRYEAAERGGDTDNDGDEGGPQPVALAAPPVGSGRGGAVDLVA